MKINKRNLKSIVFSMVIAAGMLLSVSVSAQNVETETGGRVFEFGQFFSSEGPFSNMVEEEPTDPWMQGNGGLFFSNQSKTSGDVFWNNRGLFNINANTNPGGISNADFGEQAPLGSGIAIMIGVGLGYVALKKKGGRTMKRMTYFVMALSLVLGLTQCKKEKLEPENEGKQVMITLNVGGGDNNGSKAEVDPPHVNFVDDDQILVASGRKYVGTLTKSGTTFSGLVSEDDLVEGQKLYFYFLGNKQGTLNNGATICTVNISDQTDMNDKPVISMGESNETYPSDGNSYSSRLYNKASLMKFNVTTPSNAAICITGMNNEVTVHFDNPTDSGFTYGMNTTDGGLIKMPGKDAEGVTWAIVLPQDELNEGNEGTAYTEDGVCVGQRPAIHVIDPNMYYHEGDDVISMAMGYTTLGTPLTFEAIVDNTRVSYSPYNKNEVHMEYSTDNGATWTSTTGGNITLQTTGQKVMFRASSPNSTLATSSLNTSFSCSPGSCYVYGNVMSLLDKDNYTTQTELTASYTFRRLFRNNTNIYSHSSKSLYLPATTLSDYCYQEMFYGCTNLTAAPVMTVSTVGNSSCKSMFYNCANLTTVPTLSATALNQSCYEMMFWGCTSLTETPSMNITSVANTCCKQMFRGCTSLTTVPIQLSATTLAEECYTEMFYSCSSLTDAPATLGAETLAPYCCYQMFAYCSSLITAPALPGTTLANDCYDAMFRNCTSLTTAPALPARTLASACYAFMFQNSGLTKAPMLPAIALVSSCYLFMFQNCSNLNSVTCFAQSGIEDNTYKWLENVASTGTFIKAYTANWTLNSANGIPTGWTVIPVVPGAFTIDASGKQVYFSQGNLKYSSGTWSFHTSQYDRCFTANGNVSSSYNASGTFDLFGWGTSGYNNKYPYMTSTTNNDYAPGVNEIAGTDYDWGVYNAISNGGNQAGLWHLLTNDEWGYVFKTRSASTVNGTANARYAIAYINTGGTNVYGFILFPDTYTAGTPSGVTWGTINSGIGAGAGSSATWTVCTLEGWNALESAGCVFLPAAGWRGGTTINAVNQDGGCWAGSYYPSTSGHAYNTHIYTPSKYVQPQDHSNRYVGYSVRLVHDAE